MTHKTLILFLALILLALFAPGCGRETEEPGIVARVNGDPVYLTELEFKYDLLNMDGGGPIPSVEKIRKEYGAILSELIVQRLVAQKLDQSGLSVTDEELKDAEDTVRADYPDRAFDQVLIEEYIDLKAWRKQLRARLAQQKLFQQVLRPRIKISYEEAEAYYREHLSEFYLPDRLKLVIVRGRDKTAVEDAALALAEGGETSAVRLKYPKVETREIRILRDQLPPQWQAALKGLSPGQASAVIQNKARFESLVFKEELKARVLAPSQAYTLVEKILLERKLQEVFNIWLEKALAESDIKVSAHLKEHGAVTPEAGEPSPEPGPEPRQEPDPLDDTAGSAAPSNETRAIPEAEIPAS